MSRIPYERTPYEIQITPTHSILEKNIFNKFNSLSKEGQKATEEDFIYNPKTGIIYSHHLYLSAKYGKICLAKRKPYPNYSFDLTIKELGSERKQAARMEHTISIFLENIMNCITEKKKTFVFPFIVEFPTVNHQNLLIYRRNTRTIGENTIHTIEHYEPKSSPATLTNTEYKTLRELLEIAIDQLKEEFGTNNVIFIEQHQICPLGLQEIESSYKKFQKEGGGYCVAWSALIGELVLENPEYDTKTIVETIMSIKDQDILLPEHQKQPPHHPPSWFTHYLRTVIRGYAMLMERKIHKYFKKESTQQPRRIWEETETLYEKVKPIYTKTAKKGLSRRTKRRDPKYREIFEDISLYGESSLSESSMTPTPKTPTPTPAKSPSPSMHNSRKPATPTRKQKLRSPHPVKS